MRVVKVAYRVRLRRFVRLRWSCLCNVYDHCRSWPLDGTVGFSQKDPATAYPENTHPPLLRCVIVLGRFRIAYVSETPDFNCLGQYRISSNWVGSDCICISRQLRIGFVLGSFLVGEPRIQL